MAKIYCLYHFLQNWWKNSSTGGAKTKERDILDFSPTGIWFTALRHEMNREAVRFEQSEKSHNLCSLLSVGFAQVALARHSKGKLFLCTRLLATFSVLFSLYSVICYLYSVICSLFYIITASTAIGMQPFMVHIISLL